MSDTAPVSGFRALAVLMVLAFHTEIFSGVPMGTFARTGYIGVDLFFVISGFVLFLPHARYATGQGPKPDLWRFAVSRFAKIVPPYALCLAVVAVIAFTYLSSADVAANLATHAFFVQNGFVDGFGPTVSVFWSLAVEVQFYVLFPFIAPVFRREPILTAIAMTMTALAYRFAEAPLNVADEQIMRQLPAYLDLFAAGMLAAYFVAWAQERKYRPGTDALFTYLTILGVVITVGIVRTADNVPVGWFVQNRTWFGLAAAATMTYACLAAPFLRRVIANPVLLVISTISYNVYLWHTVVLIALRNAGVTGWQQIAYGWAGTLVLSAAVTYLVERPILRRSKAWVRGAVAIPALSAEAAHR